MEKRVAAYTVRLVEDAMGWFATMRPEPPAQPAVTHWSAEFTDFAQATSVLEVANGVAQQFNSGDYAWRDR